MSVNLEKRCTSPSKNCVYEPFLQHLTSSSEENSLLFPRGVVIILLEFVPLSDFFGFKESLPQQIQQIAKKRLEAKALLRSEFVFAKRIFEITSVKMTFTSFFHSHCSQVESIVQEFDGTVDITETQEIIELSKMAAIRSRNLKRMQNADSKSS
jgi:hypothetical protein